MEAEDHPTPTPIRSGTYRHQQCLPLGRHITKQIYLLACRKPQKIFQESDSKTENASTMNLAPNPKNPSAITALPTANFYTPFLRAFKLHRSSVRFLSANLYSDAIFSIIDGLDILQVQLGPQDGSKDDEYNKKPSSQSTITNTSDDSNPSLADKRPLDHSCFASHEEDWMIVASRYPCCPSCEPSLILSMIYNLALSYHLHGLEQDNEANFFMHLQQASKIYMEFRIRFQRNNKDTPLPEMLENNLLHIQHALQSSEKPDRSLSTLEPKSNDLFLI